MSEYDRWITGGSPHKTQSTAICTNRSCPMFGYVRDVVYKVEYGEAEGIECDGCGDTLSSDGYEIRQALRENRRARELEWFVLWFVGQGNYAFDVPATD